MSFILNGFVDAVQAEGLCLNGISVLQQGEEIARHRWTPEIPQNQYSVTKSFTSTAVGMAVEEGLLSLEDQVLSYFPEEAPENPPEHLKELKIKHLLTMTLGHDAALLMGDERLALTEKDWVRYALAQPLPHRPGAHFLYNNAGPYLAGVIVEKRAGVSLIDYLTPRLFDPLNIPRPVWPLCPKGHVFGAGGMYLTTTDLAKFGQLYLQNGLWKGRQLVPEAWVRAVSTLHVPFDPPGNVSIGYGYWFWISRNGIFRADGKFGQYSLIIPEAQTVIAINSMEKEKTGRILDLVWQELLPQLLPKHNESGEKG